MNSKTKRITVIGMLCAITYVTMVVGRIPIILFLKYDPSDVIVTLGGFIWGPMTSCIVSVIVATLEMITVSDTGILGCRWCAYGGDSEMKSYRTLALKELLSQKVTSILILIAVVLSTMMTTIVGQSIGVLSAMREQQAIAIGGNRYATFLQMNGFDTMNTEDKTDE